MSCSGTLKPNIIAYYAIFLLNAYLCFSFASVDIAAFPLATPVEIKAPD
jgi:hypothetical protein